MIATLDTTAVYTAMLTMLGLVLSTLGVALVNLRAERRRGKEAVAQREHINAKLTPSNGYDSIGDGIQALEDKLGGMDDRLKEGDGRIGRIESMLTTHLNDVDPILKRALPLMERVEQMKKRKK